MSREQDLQDLQDAIDRVPAAINELAAAKRAAAYASDNATRLENTTLAALTTEAEATQVAHINSRSNPHADTAASVGTYTIPEMDALLAGLIPSGILPISATGLGMVNTLLIWPYSGDTFTVRTQSILMLGRFFTLGATTMQLSKIFGSLAEYANKDIHVYVSMSAGSPVYVVSVDRLSETLNRMYMATVRTNAAGTITVSFGTSRQRLDTFAVNNIPSGSAIARTDDMPMNPTALNAAWIR